MLKLGMTPGGVVGRLLACGAIWFALTGASLAVAQNGTLVESNVVTFKEDDIQRLEQTAPDIRQILASVDIKSMTYLSDGLKVKGYIAAPKAGTRLPAVIYNRGGNGNFAAVTDLTAVAVLGRVASWGYVVAASQYRGNMGGEGKEEFGGADVHDVLNLLPLLKANAQVDASRIGMYGRSRGGINTYLALTLTDEIVAAVVDVGWTDMVNTVKERPEIDGVMT